MKSKSPKIAKHNHYVAELGVPRDNVIDLKNKQKIDLQSIKKPGPSFLSKLQNIKFEKFFQKRNRKLDKKEAVQDEQVIVLTTSSQQTKRIIPEKQKVAKPSTPTPVSPSSLANKPNRRYIKLAFFTAVCLIIIFGVYLVGSYRQALAIKGRVLGVAQQAYDSINSAKSSISDSDFSALGEQMEQASSSFQQARDLLDTTGGTLVSIAAAVPGQARSAEKLLEAGQSLTSAGADIARTLTSLSSQENTQDFDRVITDFKKELPSLSEKLADAQASLSAVRTKDLPEEYRSQVQNINDYLPNLTNNIGKLDGLIDALLSIIGHEEQKRYLLVFQNSRELRPTGGFIGSLALVDINRGKIVNIEVPGGGVYDLAGQLQENIVSPKPLWLVNPNWNIQDSNWFPDFPASAAKTMWFFERTAKTSADGVIALNESVIRSLLDVTGPIELPQYQLTVASENFVRLTQFQAEVAYDREKNQPKKIISDLMPVLLDRAFQTGAVDKLRIFNVLANSLNSHDMLVYFNDGPAQSLVSQQNWDGAMKSGDKDYLSVIATNIGGGKTEHVINQLIRHDVSVKTDGKVTAKVTITRSHAGNPLDRWEGTANVSYLRVYVPIGSRLISADGFDQIPSSRFQSPESDAVIDSDLASLEQNPVIDELSATRQSEEFGKTVFGNWLSVNPGATKVATIEYSLPFRYDLKGFFRPALNYSAYIQKQPGLQNTVYFGSFSLPDNFSFDWTSPNTVTSPRQALYSADLKNDLFWGLLAK